MMHASGEIGFNYRIVINPTQQAKAAESDADKLPKVQSQDFSELQPAAWVMKNADDLDEEIEKNMYTFCVRLSIEYFILFFAYCCFLSTLTKALAFAKLHGCSVDVTNTSKESGIGIMPWALSKKKKKITKRKRTIVRGSTQTRV